MMGVVFIPLVYDDGISKPLSLSHADDTSSPFDSSHTIFDNTTGNSFSVSSSDFVQESQKKIESVCKERLVEMLENYCNSVGGERTV